MGSGESRWPDLRELGSLTFFAVSNGAFQAANLGLVLLAARTRTSEFVGLIALVLMSAAYTVHLNLGVFNGANREIPRAGWESDRGREMAETVVISARATFLLAGIATTGALFALGVSRNLSLLGGLYAGLWALYWSKSTLLRSRLRFDVLSRGLLALAAFYGAASLAVALGVSLEVLLLILCSGLLGVSLAWNRLLEVSWRWSYNSFRALMRCGLPIMATGLGFLAIQTVGKWFIAGFSGPSSLASFEVAHRLWSIPLFGATVVVDKYYPRLAAAWGGSSGESIERVHEELARVVGVVLVLGILGAAGIGWFTLGAEFWVTRGEGLTSILLAPGMLAASVLLVITSSLTARGNEWTALRLVLCGALFLVVGLGLLEGTYGTSAPRAAGVTSTVILGTTLLGAVVDRRLRRSAGVSRSFHTAH